MATIKSFTDLEQSKKLAEILPIESADMHWQYIEEDNGQLQWFCFPKDFSINQHNTISAWGLAAMFNIIPKKIKDFNVLRIDISDESFAIWYDEIGYGVNAELPDIEMKEPIDACYEMILKLHEQNLL